jgi:uncharacterized phage-associated protein
MRNPFRSKCKYNANQISDWILGKFDTNAGDTVSPLKLQKLLYYCQAWHYTVFDKPLFKDVIEPWAHGPTVPSQFKRFEHLQLFDSILSTPIKIERVSLEKEVEDLLNEVLDVYAEHTASYLEQLVCNELPWKETRGDLDECASCNKAISLDLMKRCYSTKRK